MDKIFVSEFSSTQLIKHQLQNYTVHKIKKQMFTDCQDKMLFYFMPEITSIIMQWFFSRWDALIDDENYAMHVKMCAAYKKQLILQ